MSVRGWRYLSVLAIAGCLSACADNGASAPALDAGTALNDAKTICEIIAFLAAALYFLYRLFGGEYVLNRLSVELSCDTPFKNKRLVRAAVKVTNPGAATLAVKDARLWIFTLADTGRPAKGWEKPADSDGAARPPMPPLTAELAFHELDLQRLSVYDRGPLGGRLRPENGPPVQALPIRQWLNLDPSSATSRQFLQALDHGLYKFEFRIITIPLFGAEAGRLPRWAGLATKSRVFGVSRYGQWAATAVVEVE